MPSSSRKELQLHGPRPPPLRVDRSSCISKAAAPQTRRSPPIIVHEQSPRVVHTSPQEFMTTVQRLTGKSGSSSSPDSFTYREFLEPSPAAAGLDAEMARAGSGDQRRIAEDQVAVVAGGGGDGDEKGLGFGRAGDERGSSPVEPVIMSLATSQQTHGFFRSPPITYQFLI